MKQVLCLFILFLTVVPAINAAPEFYAVLTYECIGLYFTVDDAGFLPAPAADQRFALDGAAATR